MMFEGNLASSQAQPQLLCHSGPVTAVSTCGKKVLWGCGNEISVFDLTANIFETRQQVLFGASLHGIKTVSVNETQELVCVWGAKQARILSLSLVGPSPEILLLSKIQDFPDWIWDVQYMSDEAGGNCLAVALAHNSVVKWNWRQEVICDQTECVEKCILYCAHLIGQTWDRLIVASGTVFNQVVLWPASCSSETGHGPVSVIHTFSGHQGVIFSVKYHHGLQRLCSVSDDRSIRMWQLSFTSGRSVSEPTVEEWKAASSEMLFVVYGHSARIWDVLLTSEFFASVGEDGTCCVWNYQGNILQRLKGHKGCNIWRLASSEDGKMLFTGGEDGSVRMWDICQDQARTVVQSSVSLPVSLKLANNDFPRSVKMLRFDQVLIMMNSGKLFSYSMRECNFSLVISDDKFRSYSVVSPCPDQLTLAVGSITGTVVLVCLPETGSVWGYTEVVLFDGKVLALNWLDKTHLMASGPAGLSLLLRVERLVSQDSKEASLSITRTHEVELPTSKHRWITAACFLPSPAPTPSVHNSHLACGDKDGSVFSFSLPQTAQLQMDTPLKPIQSLTRVHGKCGVTFACCRDGLLYTAGRDGLYRLWKVELGRLSLMNSIKIVKGLEWIDHLEWYNNDLLIYGFFSTQFVVWSVTFNQQLLSVQCGGGHRAWGCCRDNDLLRFVYLKTGTIYLVQSEHQARQTILQPALHGKKVHDVKFVKLGLDKTGEPIHVVCSGSEDTTLNIGAFMKINDFYSWTPLNTLKGHMSSVRAVVVSSHGLGKKYNYSKSIHQSRLCSVHKNCHQQSFSTDCKNCLKKSVSADSWTLFSGGGRAEIRTWKLKLIEACCIFSCKQDGKSHHSRNGNKDTIDFYSNLEENNAIQIDFLWKGDDCLEKDNSMAFLHNNSSFLAPQMDIGCDIEHLSTHFLGDFHPRQFCWRSRSQKFDPETRIMSLDATRVLDLISSEDQTVLQAEEGQVRIAAERNLSALHLLSCACSDGIFRLFLYDEHSSKKIKTLAESNFHEGCVLKALHYVHASSSVYLSFTISASTKGIIAFWPLDQFVAKVFSDLKSRSQYLCNSKCGTGPSCNNVDCQHATEEDSISDEDVENSDVNAFLVTGVERLTLSEDKDWKPVFHIKTHQSGVNSIHLLQVNECQALLASGGDDNAVMVQLLEVSSSGIKLLDSAAILGAHAAQVTGIHILSPDLLVSASIDQRVCLWRIQREPHLQLQFVSCRYIHVADVSSLSVHFHGNTAFVCIGGEGLCLYKLNLSDYTCECPAS